MALRAPHLFQALRCFCLAGFAVLSEELENGAEIPFAFETHNSPGRPALYEYRPLIRGFVTARAKSLASSSARRGGCNSTKSGSSKPSPPSTR